MQKKWSQFPNGGNVQQNDIVVGLRSGTNYQFTASPYPSQIVIVTANNYQMVPNTIYIIDEQTAPVILELPTTSKVGDLISIVGMAFYGWKITQSAGQQIFVSPSFTTLGSGGSIASSAQYDSLNLMCITQNTTWTSFGGGQTNGFVYI